MHDKKPFTDRIVRHLLELSSGTSNLTEADVVAEGDPRLRTVLEALHKLQASLTHERKERRELIDQFREKAESARSTVVLTAEQFRLAVDTSPIPMLMIDASGTVLIANAEIEDLMGHDHGTLVGESIAVMMPDRYWPLEDHLERYFGAPDAIALGPEHDVYARRKDGAEFPVELGLNPLHTPTGVFLLATVLDLTERKKSEAARYLASIVESSYDPIFGIDLDRRITSWNRAAEKLYGYKRGEVVERHLDVLFPPAQRDEIEKIADAVRRGDRVDALMTEHLTRSGGRVHVSLSISPIRSGDGPEADIVGASVIARDITQRVRAERKLENALQDLARSNQALEEFAYVASHDLKEPLRTIASYTGLLAAEYGERLDAAGRKYLELAEGGAKRMHAMIVDILEYSRLGKRRLVRREIPLASIVEEVRTALAPSIQETDARIHYGELPTLLVDPHQMARLMQNLVANSIKFRSADRPDIRISAEEEDGAWTVSVQDNGIGIDPGYADRIFSVFQRLHPRERYTGSGIGLAIAKRIIDRHGGTIWVESSPGEGATFRFRLPLLAGQKLEDTAEMARPRRVGSTHGPGGARAAARAETRRR